MSVVPGMSKSITVAGSTAHPAIVTFSGQFTLAPNTNLLLVMLIDGKNPSGDGQFNWFEPVPSADGSNPPFFYRFLSFTAITNPAWPLAIRYKTPAATMAPTSMFRPVQTPLTLTRMRPWPLTKGAEQHIFQSKSGNRNSAH